MVDKNPEELNKQSPITQSKQKELDFVIKKIKSIEENKEY